MASRPYQLAWYACDLRTGAIAEELRSLTPSGPLSRRLGDATSCSFDLNLSGAPPEWEAATDPGRTILVAVDALTGAPVWAGAVVGPREGGSTGAVSLSAVTLEAYLDRRYTGDYTTTATDDAQILTALVTPALTGGPPLVVDAVNTGVSRDYQVADADDKTILSAVQGLAGLDGGPEWTIDVAWADAAQTKFQFPVRVRATIGAQYTQPEGVFDLPGCVSSYALTESYESGQGATVVTAYGDTSDGARTQSAVHTATSLIAGGWPLWEYRWTPSDSSTSTASLDAAAAKALALMATGSRAWTVEAVASRAPRLGTDWGLGDLIRLTVAPTTNPAVPVSQRHPAGVELLARAWAWELDPAADRVRPILVEGG